jgi:hypothetical protein
MPAILFRWPGVLSPSMNRMIQEVARRQAALPTATLIARNRAMVGVHRHSFGVTKPPCPPEPEPQDLHDHDMSVVKSCRS